MAKKSGKSSLPPPPGRIEVVAIRAGVYKQFRKKVGDKFSVGDMSEVGSWMRCVDPKLEEKKLDMLAKKVEKAKAAAAPAAEE